MNPFILVFLLISLLGKSDTQALPVVPPKIEQKAALASQYETNRKKQIWVTITAYSSEPGQTDSTPFITASGKGVRDGVIAANFLDFGTQVKIPELFGDRTFEVQDRMHHRFSDRIDIWMESTEEAKQFGRQYALVEIEL